MGSAVPVIGLGLQGLGMLTSGGGTQYSPDPRAKYEADLMALKEAEINTQRQADLLRQQTDVANQITDYQREAEYWNLQSERDYAKASIENQYQQQIYQLQLSQADAELTDFRDRAAIEFNRMSIDQQARRLQDEASFNTAQQQTAYQINQGGRQGQVMNAQGQRSLKGAQNQLQGQNLDLQDVALQGKRNELGIQNQSIDQTLQGLNQQASQGRQNLTMQEGQNNINYGQQVSGANLQKQQQMLQLFASMSKDENEFKNLVSRMQGLGIGSGVQEATTLDNLMNNTQNASQRQLINAQFGNQLGQAEIGRNMGQAQVDAGRMNLQDEYIQKSLGLDLQRMGITQGNADIARQQETNNIARRGLGLENISNDYELQSFINNLGYEGQQDYLQRVILPDIQGGMARRNADMDFNLGQGQQDIAEFLRQQTYDFGQQQRDLGRQGLDISRQGAGRTLDADYARQLQAMDAAKRSGKSTNEMQLAAALSSLAGNQYGLLSAIGAGLSNPAPSRGGGGGINFEGLASLAQGVGGYLARNQGNSRNTGLLSSPNQGTIYPSGQSYLPSSNFNAPRTGNVTGTYNSGTRYSGFPNSTANYG